MADPVEVPLFFRSPIVVDDENWLGTSASVATAFSLVGHGSFMQRANPIAIEADGAGRYKITVELDDRQRPHSGNGKPAIERDGKQWWYWHGVEVPERVVTAPETITVAEIEAESNSEVRRVMIERYGQTRYLQDCGARIVHQDDYGILYQKRFKGQSWDDPITFVKVKNSTPEPDGTFKDYILRVPPNVRTARSAVAWTFGIQSQNYKPELET